jgi:ribosomal protein L22
VIEVSLRLLDILDTPGTFAAMAKYVVISQKKARATASVIAKAKVNESARNVLS